MVQVVRASEAVVRQISPSHQASNFITKTISPGVSLAVNQGDNHLETDTTKYNRLYYVLEGQLNITVDGVTEHVDLGDACFVSQNTSYTFGGTFKAVVVNQPAFGSLPQ